MANSENQKKLKILLGRDETELSLWNKDRGEWVKDNEDDYSTIVPAEIKNKVKEVHWTENIWDLRELVLQGKLS